MATWNVAFEASPANADSPSQGAAKIRELKTEISDRADKEHTWSGTVAADGIHRAGSAKVYFTTAAPTLQPDNATALGAGDKGRLYWKSSTGSALLIHNGSAFVSTGVTLSTTQAVYGVKTFKSGAILGPTATIPAKRHVISIGSWDMDTTAAVQIPTGRTFSSTVTDVSAVIRIDSVWRWFPLLLGGTISIISNGTYVTLTRVDSGFYDNASYNSTGFNRGYVTIWYT